MFGGYVLSAGDRKFEIEVEVSKGSNFIKINSIFSPFKEKK